MALLQKAKVEQASAKVGIFGRQGSGKTTTSALIALGLSKTYHANAPVAFLDTENGSDYLVPIFEAEGVELLVIKSRAFADMKAALKEAEANGCCTYLVDSYTHPWRELCDTFKAKSRRKKLEFHHMDALKQLWQAWTDLMLNSPLHIILSGRLGFEWGEEETDEGRNLIKLGTKMKSESEAGYEPSLLIEMEGLQSTDAREKQSRTKKGTIVHHCYVIKDRWRALNGRTFVFKDINQYKPGDYKKVFDAFQPHWSKLVIGGVQKAVDGSRSSGALFSDATGESLGAQMARRREIACEEIEGILAKMWPGQDANSKATKRDLLYELFATYSWTAVQNKDVQELENAVVLLREFKVAAETSTPSTPTEAVGLLQLCRARVVDEAPEAETEPQPF
jgi:hypothetical protein